MMREFQLSSLFNGANAPYIEELYEQYLADPAAVPEAWRKQFDALPNVAGSTARDVAHTPVIEAFAERAKQGSGRIAYVNVGGAGIDDLVAHHGGRWLRRWIPVRFWQGASGGIAHCGQAAIPAGRVETAQTGRSDL